MRFRRLACLLIAAVFLPVRQSVAADITVSAAISLKEALADAGRAFEKKTGDHVSFNFLASGPLMKQIENGAPVDVFVSAAHKQLDDLKKENLIDRATERVVAKNQLVLVVPSGAINSPGKFEDLSDARFQRIAIGEPRSVPAGDYAMQTLAALKLTDALKDRLKMGANVRQVLDYVERGEVDAGIVYRTDALISGGKVRIVATADESTHQPIEYPGAVIAASKQHDDALHFLEFLHSTDGTEILTRYGFASATSPTTLPAAR